MEVARHWRLKAQRYRLEGSFCPVCGQVSFPPRSACRHNSPDEAQSLELIFPASFRSSATESCLERTLIEVPGG